MLSDEKRLKLFLACNQFAELNLDKIERCHAIDLKRGLHHSEDKDSVYYPQFDKKIRVQAAEMSKHYEIFYCLERTARKIIADALETVEPKNWWNATRIPQNIFSDVTKRMQRERDSGMTMRSEDPLDFTTLGELSEIIKHNWSVFGSIFNSVKAVEKVMNSLNAIRGPIAHCTALAEDEALRLKLSVRDWFRLME
jgi:hypothetical protein